MKEKLNFSFSRWRAIVSKEFIQLKRDRMTFAMIMGIPIIQLLLFGYAINTDPKHVPTAVVATDFGMFTRSFISAMKNSEYFKFQDNVLDEQGGKKALNAGDVMFVVTIPENFTRKLLRGEKPSILFEADASDPIAIGNAVSALNGLIHSVIQRDFKGPLQYLSDSGDAPFNVLVHKLYNPESITQYHIVPGLMGVVLTLTLVMMTALAITREQERGTMENLLSMPVKPLEVITGKIVPYIFIGLIQSLIIVLTARYLYQVPFLGSAVVLFLMVLLFILGNLMTGITISSFARTQMQALQMTIFIYLPSVLLTGFMFPFFGMPGWAQKIGNVMPLTYFIRVVRGIMLKGSSWTELWPNIWPLLIFIIVMLFVGIRCYRKTLE